MNDYKELVEIIRNYSEEIVAYKMGCEFANAVYNATNAIEQLVKERDAAIKDLHINSKCWICKNACSPITLCKYYGSCGLAYIHWEWRGVK